MRLETGATFAGYRVDGVLGEGGMGVVYVATQLTLDRKVALKTVRPEYAADPAFRERFLREARLAAAIEHANLLPVYEAGEHDGILYLVVRHVAGPDLRAVLAKEGTLAPARAVELVRQVAQALDVAHAAGIVHRDVKPANVLIAGSPGAEHVYLSDFGLARWSEGVAITRTGELSGTAAYVAPEQIEGRAVDGRADQYALACVLVECLTGAPPYVRDAEVATLWAHMHAEPPHVSAERLDVSPELDGVIRRALAKDPEARFASAGAFAAAAQAAIPAMTPADVGAGDGEPGRAATSGGTPDTAAGGRGGARRRGPLVVAGALIVAFVIVAGVLAFGPFRATPSGSVLRLAWLERTVDPAGGAAPCDYAPTAPPDALIHVADVRGTDVGPLLEVAGCDPALSPDGHLLAWVDDQGLHVTDIVAGRSVRVLLDPGLSSIASPAWAPDSDPAARRLAFVATGAEDAAYEQLRLATLDTHDLVADVTPTSTCAWPIGEGPAAAPAWSPDGTQIAFVEAPHLLFTTEARCEATPRTIVDAMLAGGDVLYDHPTWSRPNELLVTGMLQPGSPPMAGCAGTCLFRVDLRDDAPLPVVAVSQPDASILDPQVTPDCPLRMVEPASSPGRSTIGTGAPETPATETPTPTATAQRPPTDLSTVARGGCGPATLLTFVVEGGSTSAVELQRGASAQRQALVSAARPDEVRGPTAIALP